MSSATFWLMRLSSASRTRRVDADTVAVADRRRVRRSRPSTARTSARCSWIDLAGLTSSAKNSRASASEGGRTRDLRRRGGGPCAGRACAAHPPARHRPSPAYRGRAGPRRSGDPRRRGGGRWRRRRRRRSWRPISPGDLAGSGGWWRCRRRRGRGDPPEPPVPGQDRAAPARAPGWSARRSGTSNPAPVRCPRRWRLPWPRPGGR